MDFDWSHPLLTTIFGPEYFKVTEGSKPDVPDVIGYICECQVDKTVTLRFKVWGNDLTNIKTYMKCKHRQVDRVDRAGNYTIENEIKGTSQDDAYMSRKHIDEHVLTRYNVKIKHPDFRTLTLVGHLKITERNRNYLYKEQGVMVFNSPEEYDAWLQQLDYITHILYNRQVYPIGSSSCLIVRSSVSNSNKDIQSYSCSIAIMSPSSVLTPCLSVPTVVCYRLILTFTFEKRGILCGQPKRFEVDEND
jgi:hypothetical protein